MKWKNPFYDFTVKDFIFLFLVGVFSLGYVFYPFQIDWDKAKDWDGLLGGLLALLGSIFTVFIMWSIHIEPVKRRKRAIRVGLPDLLIRNMDYIKDGFNYIYFLKIGEEKKANLPLFSPEQHIGLIDYAEYFYNENTYNLLRTVQVIKLSIDDYILDESRNKFEHIAFRLVYTYAIFLKMLKNVDVNILSVSEPNKDDLFDALNSITDRKFASKKYNGLKDIIEERIERGVKNPFSWANMKS